MQLVDANAFSKGLIIYDQQSPYTHEIRGRYFKLDSDGKKVMENGSPVEVSFTARVRLYEELERAVLESGVFDTKQPNTMVIQFFWGVLPILLIGLISWFFFIRQIKMAGKGALSFGMNLVIVQGIDQALKVGQAVTADYQF